ncbi:hypothetical protein BDA96_08G149300 [Sorghum bicolor]|uniref:Uncharacterized protein n=1 Tax=Sorghum bicolor TaxID=4558 RepID=A0A921U770_SORBI|nr:hypothetical protein BDA96_08G149300 [Sorghum bicolor]
MVGLFCKSCSGAKLVSCPVCYRALFVQVKSVRALVYFRGVIGAAGVCAFSHLVFGNLHTLLLHCGLSGAGRVKKQRVI